MNISDQHESGLPVLKQSRWNVLYRGRLSSCNYGCPYCPFAKTKNTKVELAEDRAQLERFVGWVSNQKNQTLGVFFTPWGEALIHHYYRNAMIRLSKMPQVSRVAIQTNLSCSVADFKSASKQKVAFWATFHPGENTLERFVERCNELDGLGLRYSVGMVGMKEHLDVLQQLRHRINPNVYVWVNAYKRENNYYTVDEVDLIRRVDPYFDLNCHYYESGGKACHAGETSFTVDGEGNMRRCHFISDKIGNIYEPGFAAALRQRICLNETCGCHIGYVNRPELDLNKLFGENSLERIPTLWPELDERFLAMV